MGDIADMMLEGLLDEETGEYIGDINEDRFGSASTGFPVSYEREAREKKKANIARNAAQKKTKCPICGKKVKVTGLAMHTRDVHGAGKT